MAHGHNEDAMITPTIRVIILGLLLLTTSDELAYGQGAGDVKKNNQTFSAPSDIFAAFLVAYEEHRKWWKSNSVDLNPRELTARHWAIHLLPRRARSSERIVPPGIVWDARWRS